MLSRLILCLYEEAQEQGRLLEQDETASDVLRVLRYGAPANGTLTKGESIGLELRSGNVQSPEAKAIRAKALRSIEDYDTFLRCLERIGYTLQLLRAALTVHRERLKSEPLGSDGNCIYIDVQDAIAHCSEEHKVVLKLLVEGESPRRIGELIGGGGSARIARALRQMSRYLERPYGKKTKRRR